VVFLILYDFFKIKGNKYLLSFPLVDLLRRLFYKFPFTDGNKTKKSKKIELIKTKSKKNLVKLLTISKRKIVMIKALSLSLDIDFGYYNYDKLRNLFTILVTNDNYPIPDERVALLEYRRILSQGMAGIVGKINRSIINNPDLLLSKFEIEDKNALNDNTLFIAIYNSIKRSWEIVQS
jgi:hypothetical protein